VSKIPVFRYLTLTGKKSGAGQEKDIHDQNQEKTFRGRGNCFWTLNGNRDKLGRVFYGAERDAERTVGDVQRIPERDEKESFPSESNHGHSSKKLKTRKKPAQKSPGKGSRVRPKVFRSFRKSRWTAADRTPITGQKGKGKQSKK